DEPGVVGGQRPGGGERGGDAGQWVGERVTGGHRLATVRLATVRLATVRLATVRPVPVRPAAGADDKPGAGGDVIAESDGVAVAAVGGDGEPGGARGDDVLGAESELAPRARPGR